MRRAAIVAACVCLASCAWQYPPAGPRFRPEATHTAPDLSATVAPADGREAPFELRFYPSAVSAGGATWMTCHVPPSWPRTARIVMAFEGKFRSDVPIEERRPFLVDNIPCGMWAAVCEVYVENGSRRIARNTIEAAGCEPGRDALPRPAGDQKFLHKWLEP